MAARKRSGNSAGAQRSFSAMTLIGAALVAALACAASACAELLEEWAAQEEQQAAPLPTRPLSPPPELPDYVSYTLNAGYDAISAESTEAAIALMVQWYETEYDLTAELPSLIKFEPECKDQWGLREVLGYAKLSEDELGNNIMEICIRLDENDETVFRSEAFKWVLAHEYFHVLQANAGWGLDSAARCREQLIEGSAEYFGQIYAAGKIDGIGFGDLLDVFLDTERFYHYEVGAEAFEALIKWQGKEKVVGFWESDQTRCADAFLAEFGVAPGKYESDWQDLTRE